MTSGRSGIYANTVGIRDGTGVGIGGIGGLFTTDALTAALPAIGPRRHA